MVQMRRSPEGVAAWGWAAAALGAYDLLWVNFQNPVLRFSDPVANEIVFLVGQGLPWVAMWLLIGARPVPVRVVAQMAGAVLCLWSGLWVLLTTMELSCTLEAGHDGSFQPIAEIATPDGRLRAYQTNGGAMTSFGVMIQQEHDILPGLHRVRQLEYRYRTYGARLERLPKRRVRVIWNADDADFAGPLLTLDDRGRYHVYAAKPE